VPAHLKDGSRDGAELGHGVGYRYPHAFENHWVAQQYLPDAQKGAFFYHPSSSGEEGDVKKQIEERRLATWAALSENQSPLASAFSSGPSDKDWEQRSLDNASESMGIIIDSILQTAELKRDHLVLELGAGSGVLTFRAMEKVRVGGVVAYLKTLEEKQNLESQLKGTDPFHHPELNLFDSLDEFSKQIAGHRFDRIFIRSFFESNEQASLTLDILRHHLAEGGLIILGHFDLKQDQRLSQLLAPDHPVKDMKIFKRFQKLEEDYFSDGTWFCPEDFLSENSSWEAHHQQQTFRIQKRLREDQILSWLKPSAPLGAMIYETSGEDTRSEVTDLLTEHLAGNHEWVRHFCLSIFKPKR
jgi:putative ATPase